MFGKKKQTAQRKRSGKPADIRLPEGLSKREQKQVRAIIEQAIKDDGVPRTAQQSIPFQRMFPDGICRVVDRYYTKTIQYQDINYQLAQEEDQKAIFEEWCGFLNFFDSSIRFELSCLCNRRLSERTDARVERNRQRSVFLIIQMFDSLHHHAAGGVIDHWQQHGKGIV